MIGDIRLHTLSLMNPLVIFLTGLTTGGLSCLAVQGGLLTGVIANQKDRELTGNLKSTKALSFDRLDWLPVTIFLLAKLISHTALGFLLGLLGSSIELSLNLRLVFQGLAALFMLATAANLLDLHPVFRYVIFTPPKFVYRWLKNTSHGQALFTPAILGFFTIFIPCGVTQAMEVLAITSGYPIVGAAIMFFFVLGTSPLFGLVGIATAKLSEFWSQKFLKIAAYSLIFLSLSSLNGIFTVLDAPLTGQKIIQPLVDLVTLPDRLYDQKLQAQGGLQVSNQVTINIVNNGYSPSYFKVQAGRPVNLTLKTNGVYSCATSFVMRSFNLFAQLGPNDQKTLSFTPQKKGRYTFSCSMGMYQGIMEVI